MFNCGVGNVIHKVVIFSHGWPSLVVGWLSLVMGWPSLVVG